MSAMYITKAKTRIDVISESISQGDISGESLCWRFVEVDWAVPVARVNSHANDDPRYGWEDGVEHPKKPFYWWNFRIRKRYKKHASTY